MPGLLPHVDPNGLLEYSVVYTDRALNHMSQSFQQVMRDISKNLKEVYRADGVVIVPGSGTFGMEAVARQFATGKKCLVLRNGWFSFRWTQILEMGSIPATSKVLKARRMDDSRQPAFAPPAIENVLQMIQELKPDVVFAPHVETSAGMILPDDYIQSVGKAVHAVGGLFVLDCIASGTIWIDMRDLDVDVLISAPQKGWSGSPCCGLVMLNERALELMAASESTSFACDLGKWHDIMQAYEKGGHAYHATMPTDGLATFNKVMHETMDFGLMEAKRAQEIQGTKIREVLKQEGFKSVAAMGFEAPGVVVCYTNDPDIQKGKKFAQAGIQIAAGVPLRCDEPEPFTTFRLGLFGLDKLNQIDRTVMTFKKALNKVV